MFLPELLNPELLMYTLVMSQLYQFIKRLTLR